MEKISETEKHPDLIDLDSQETPYYTERHKRFREYVRKAFKELINKYWDGYSKYGEDKALPKEFIKTLATKYPSAYFFPFGYGEFEGSNEWDPFYTIIFCYETMGAQGGLGAWIHYICLPVIIHFGTQEIHKKVFEEVRSGDKTISLAVSEMGGGSDVANIKTTAVKDGDHYIINGSKYWITGGNRADYFVTLARTGDKTRQGVSLILVPRTTGVFTSKMKLQGANLNDTASITFKDVRVPISYVIGEENAGFKPLMYNFNFERFVVAADMVASCRWVIEDSIKWAKERTTFGKPLIKHQVIRHKLAEMTRECISTQSLLERTAYQLKFDKFGRKDKSIPRNVALLKVQSSRSAQSIAIQSSQIFGGRSYVRGGRGAAIEENYRLVRAGAIAAGSEEIMLDLAVSQAML